MFTSGALDFGNLRNVDLNPLYEAGTMQLNLITLGGENLYGGAVGSPLAGAFPGRAQAR